MAWDPPRANGWTLAHFPPSSEWGHSGNTGEIKAARKGTGHPTSKSRWLRTSTLSNRHPPMYGSYMGLTFYSSSFTFSYPLKDGKFSVPITAALPEAEILLPDNIDFHLCAVGDQRQKSFEIINIR